MSIEEVFSRGSSTKDNCLQFWCHYVAFHTSREYPLFCTSSLHPKGGNVVVLGVLAAHHQMDMKIQFRVALLLNKPIGWIPCKRLQDRAIP
ncbi:hypothetical protein OUZ56_033830 [Daphnia magna]|uniref:Uncharacterized protein n=1 Tax=Daphnia magna TaxID=35525 RepID=A0ABQ9ZYA4_9CRUS|nr:hypothetical protein OUZ56_033830 [Daphnia magna]